MQPPPETLYNLLIGNHSEHGHAKQIMEDGFMSTFKVKGQVYHFHESLLSGSVQKAQFLEKYFLGEDEKEAQVRCFNCTDLKKWLVKQLQKCFIMRISTSNT